MFFLRKILILIKNIYEEYPTVILRAELLENLLRLKFFEEKDFLSMGKLYNWLKTQKTRLGIELFSVETTKLENIFRVLIEDELKDGYKPFDTILD